MSVWGERRRLDDSISRLYFNKMGFLTVRLYNFSNQFSDICGVRIGYSEAGIYCCPFILAVYDFPDIPEISNNFFRQ
jgi:hypothetical protein